MSGRKTGLEDSGSEQQHKSKRQRRTSTAEIKTIAVHAMELEHLSADTNEAPTVGPRGMIDRTQYLRLLQQSLSQLGYPTVAEQLEKTSGVPCQSRATSNLQTCVLKGDWDAALKCLDAMEDMALALVPHAKFHLLEQKFLEILESGDDLAAVKCLRNELTPLGVNIARLHELSRKLVPENTNFSTRRQPQNGNKDKRSEDGELTMPSVEAGRRKALQALRAYLPTGALLREGRLEELIEQALASQIEKCRLHNSTHPKLSLLKDYSAGIEQLPLHCSQILQGHTSEVWHLQFSHDGKMLATCGRDCKVILWRVGGKDSVSSHGRFDPGNEGDQGHVSLHRILTGHTSPVQFLAWSPDDSILASCGQDCQVRLWSPTASAGTPACLRVLQHHREPVLSACWLPDNQTLVTAGQDRLVAVVGVDGEVHQNWRAHRMQDVVVTTGGRYILASTHDRRINVYEAMSRPKSVESQEEGGTTSEESENEGDEDFGWLFASRYDTKNKRDFTMMEGEDLMAFSLSPCGRYLLANLRDGTLSLWDLGTHSKTKIEMPMYPLARFTPPDNPEGNIGRFVVRSCLGGVGGKFVVTGTESGAVPIWQRDTGELIAVIEGHKGTVNAVAWNIARPEILATASDDGTVRIWRPQETAAGGEAEMVES